MQATRPAAFTTQQQRAAARSGRRLQRCYAATEEEKLDFSANKRAVGAAAGRGLGQQGQPHWLQALPRGARWPACATGAAQHLSTSAAATPYCLQLGFTDSDSAGQSNVFAVEPKSYVAGSSADSTSEGAKVTFVVGLVAALVAFAACAAFLLADTKPSSECRTRPPASLPASQPASQPDCMHALLRSACRCLGTPLPPPALSLTGRALACACSPRPAGIADLAPAADAKTLTAYSQQFAAEASPALAE